MSGGRQTLRKRTDTASSGSSREHELDESSTSTEATLSDTEYESEESISSLNEFEQRVSEKEQSDVYEDNVIIELDQIQGDLIKFITFDDKEITIEKVDLVCLAGQNYLNEIVIQFYLEYIKAKLITKARAKKCFIFSTYFFAPMLTLKRNPKTDNHYLDAIYELGKKWTDNYDIFQYDYLIVPIFNSNHWSLAIICHAGKLLSDVIDLESKERTCILFMDSFSKVKNLPQYSRILRYFIQKEIETRKMMIKLVNPEIMPTINPVTPKQTNEYDCGLFLLHYAEKFLKDPNIIFNNSRLTKINLKAWFDNSILITKRMEIFDAAVEINKENLKDRNDVPYVTDAGMHNDEKDTILVEENEYTRQLKKKKQKNQEIVVDPSPEKGRKKMKLLQESDTADVGATLRSDLATKFHELFDESAEIPVAKISTGQRPIRTKADPLPTSSSEIIETITLSTSPLNLSSLNVDQSPPIPLVYSPSEMICSLTEVASTSNSTKKPVQNSLSCEVTEMSFLKSSSTNTKSTSPKRAPIHRSIPFYGIDDEDDEDDEELANQSSQKHQNQIILQSFNSQSSGTTDFYLKRTSQHSSRGQFVQNSFTSRASGNITQRFKDAAFDYDSSKFDEDSE